MSKQEAVSAFLKGSIGRREFVQRLGVAGVSATAAVAYANALRPSSAAASGAANAAGFRRAFQDDDYAGGTEVPTEVPGGDAVEAIAQALTALIDTLNSILDNVEAILADLGVSGPIAQRFTANITRLISNLQEQLDGLGGVAYVPGASGVRALQADGSSLQAVGESLDKLAGTYSSLLASTTEIDLANQLGPYAIVVGRQAAYINTILGNDPFPNAAEAATSASELSDAAESLSS